MLGATFLFYMPRYTHLILLILEILVMKMSKFCSPSLSLQKTSYLWVFKHGGDELP